MQERALKGAGFGVAMVIAYSLAWFVFWTARGRGPSAALLSEVIATLVPGGAATGLLVGLAQPLITNLARSMAIFFLASLPLAYGIQRLYYDAAPNRAETIAVIAAFAGMIGGTMYWNRDVGP